MAADDIHEKHELIEPLVGHPFAILTVALLNRSEMLRKLGNRGMRVHVRVSRIKPASAIKQASARSTSRLRANRSACAGQRAIARVRAKSLFSAPDGMSASRFHVGGVENTIGRPSAPAQPSMTPRARPNANAATFASVGRAPTNSQKATRACVRARIPASKGALVAALPFASGVDGISITSRSWPAALSTATAP